MHFNLYITTRFTLLEGTLLSFRVVHIHLSTPPIVGSLQEAHGLLYRPFFLMGCDSPSLDVDVSPAPDDEDDDVWSVAADVPLYQ